MNQTEWKKLAKFDKSQLDWTYYNKSKAIQKSLIYNPDPNATVKHHLRDTPEQREYNDKYYELWGHNLDGTFEYGKYMIFMTPEEHNKLHNCSDEKRKKISEANKGKCVSEETRKKISKKLSEVKKGRCSGENNPNYGKHFTDEHKKRISESRKGKCVGEDHPFYGKHLSDDTKKKISDTRKQIMTDELRERISKTVKEAMASEEVKQKLSESHKGIRPSDETRMKMSESHKQLWDEERRKAYSENNSGEKSCWYGKHHSSESKSKMSESQKQLWDEERKLSYTGSGNPFYGKCHTEETLAKIKRTKQEKKTMFENIRSRLSDLTWKLFSSCYSKYKKELRRAPSLEEMYNYIMSNTQKL